ncbi:hypothetical protein BpHYR1_036724 [Brachionus plicatilis]|uniref:Uncharacterized protein n=1 Tax=Brachionus plicatilis TaxID=10195 RepID=A0A3M7RKW4_BRAPC|nr:hypothetical protein BpHYR1_036724 [Brachionus plicatilis]
MISLMYQDIYSTDLLGESGDILHDRINYQKNILSYSPILKESETLLSFEIEKCIDFDYPHNGVL